MPLVCRSSPWDKHISDRSLVEMRLRARFEIVDEFQHGLLNGIGEFLLRKHLIETDDEPSGVSFKAHFKSFGQLISGLRARADSRLSWARRLLQAIGEAATLPFIFGLRF